MNTPASSRPTDIFEGTYSLRTLIQDPSAVPASRAFLAVSAVPAHYFFTASSRSRAHDPAENKFANRLRTFLARPGYRLARTLSFCMMYL
eukprot:608571-Pleurochrysis_carterae.AAC.1